MTQAISGNHPSMLYEEQTYSCFNHLICQSGGLLVNISPDKSILISCILILLTKLKQMDELNLDFLEEIN